MSNRSIVMSENNSAHDCNTLRLGRLLKRETICWVMTLKTSSFPSLLRSFPSIINNHGIDGLDPMLLVRVLGVQSIYHWLDWKPAVRSLHWLAFRCRALCIIRWCRLVWRPLRTLCKNACVFHVATVLPIAKLGDMQCYQLLLMRLARTLNWRFRLVMPMLLQLIISMMVIDSNQLNKGAAEHDVKLIYRIHFVSEVVMPLKQR